MNPLHHLPSGCLPLDAMLQGGLESDACALVFGEAGSGKTNFALECARQAVDEGRRVAYVDTEGVSPVRLEQVFGDRDLGRLLFYTPFSIAEQERMVQRTTLLQDLGLVVVDSINMHYRLHIDGGDDAEKVAARSLYAQLHHLTTYARQHNVPVLVTGQVYGSEDATQPFARRVMEHLVKILVRFEKRPDGSRRATLLKHRSIPEGTQALFRIGASGLEPRRPAPPRAAPPETQTHGSNRREGTPSAGGQPPDDADIPGDGTATGFRPAHEAPRSADPDAPVAWHDPDASLVGHDPDAPFGGPAADAPDILDAPARASHLADRA